jgi:AcrR family transcriptional regulator
MTDSAATDSPDSAATDSPDKPGLRERKKARTRATIQEHALRLFREQGYEATTVEQIAAAAEVSPSTFFRYFGTKEDVVIYDALDPVLIAAWRAQPAELGPVEAIRRAMKQVFGRLTPAEFEDMMERGRLVYEVPELRLAMIDDLVRTSDLIVREVARRTRRPVDDFDVRVFSGALIGALMGAMLPALEDPRADMLALLDRAFDLLEKGLPL